MILDGIALREKGAVRMKEFISASSARPHLAIVQVGDRQDSNTYVSQKESFGKKIGAEVTRVRLPEMVTQKELEESIERLNARKDVHGIILQLPIPSGLDASAAIEKIDPHKDVDGLTNENQRTGAVIPATTRGILELLDQNGVEISGKKVAIIGRSKLVGAPTARAFIARGADVSVIHSQTGNPQTISAAADIVIVATGKGGHFGKEYFSSGQVVVDVGISPSKASIRGDVRFDEVMPIVRAISPVPGGVGPMTVLSLFENLLDAYKKHL